MTSRAAIAFVDSLERGTFRWFWDLRGIDSVLTPDREPTRSFSSVGAIGFALTAYPIGAERGWVRRDAAARRARATLEYLWRAPQDSSGGANAGYRGFFYHFLVPETGARFKDVELSTIDTALLLAGALFCESYFDRRNPVEARVRALAESLYARADWRWMQVRPPTLALGWTPEKGFLPYDWRGYDEAMLLQVLALGATRHPVEGDVWEAWTRGYRWGTFQGEEYIGFAPLFGYQYSHIWIDFRGIQDDYTKKRGIDYFENSRRATRAQHAYALANPGGFRGYGPRLWGLSACDGPIDSALVLGGRSREFHTYEARGASFVRVTDDGTIAPCAAAGSIAFEPELVIPTLRAMREDFGADAFGAHGFVDALNPTLNVAVRVPQGRIVPGVGWFDTDRLGIDQGPILAMIENWRSGLVWRVMRRNPHMIRGLRRAGFRGGWLTASPGRP
ncbi:MAG TPA: glucoamylase family protein [Candidatus Udaeobacter sp.]|nr:glucoamylase family protein [Candidatus Udaeobacter sp.]